MMGVSSSSPPLPGPGWGGGAVTVWRQRDSFCNHIKFVITQCQTLSDSLMIRSECDVTLPKSNVIVGVCHRAFTSKLPGSVTSQV